MKRQIFFYMIISLLISVSFIITERYMILNKFYLEIKHAKQSRVINNVLLNYAETIDNNESFLKHFKPIVGIENFKKMQFVFEKDGTIMHHNTSDENTDLNFDFRMRSWYQCAKKLRKSKELFCLSDIYMDFWSPHDKVLTYSYPIYHNNNLIGVGLHDIYIKELRSFAKLVNVVGVDNKNIVFSIDYSRCLILFFLMASLLYSIKLLCTKSFIFLLETIYKDDLTGLNTRKTFKYSQNYMPIKSICLIDIDHFKRVNDTYGHDIGDQYLKIVAKTLKGSTRTCDRLFRWGGEEFLLIISDDGSNDINSQSILERIRKNVSEAYFPKGQKVTITIGYYENKEKKDFIEMIKLADRALYDGKNSGRNIVIKYTK